MRAISMMISGVIGVSLVATTMVTQDALSQGVADETICYMQTPNRQVIDLTHLCGRDNRVQPSRSTRSVRSVRRGRNARQRLRNSNLTNSFHLF
jgi:hypothetical protein